MFIKGEKSIQNIKSKHLNTFQRIRRGSNFNAYHRLNLGSIPSKIDNFIFKLPEVSKNNLSNILNPSLLQDENLCFRKDIFNHDHKSWRNFGSGNSIELKGNSLKFSVNNDIKTLKYNKSDYDLSNIEQFKTIYTHSNISTNHTNINDNKDENNDKIEKNNKMKEKKDKFSKEDRYHNMFYRSEFINRYFPGPGEYDFLGNKNNQFRYESLFKGKCSFPIPSINDYGVSVGPGSYDYIEKRNIPGGSFSVVKKYKNQYKVYVGPTSLNLPGSINIKDKDKKNFFFLLNKPKKKVK